MYIYNNLVSRNVFISTFKLIYNLSLRVVLSSGCIFTVLYAFAWEGLYRRKNIVHCICSKFPRARAYTDLGYECDTQYSLETSFYTSIFESHPRHPRRRPFNRIPGPLYIRTHLFRWHLQPLSPKSRDHGRRRQQWRADATPERLEAVLGRSHQALAYAGHWYSPRELVAVYAHDYKWKKVCIHVL